MVYGETCGLESSSKSESLGATDWRAFRLLGKDSVIDQSYMIKRKIRIKNECYMHDVSGFDGYGR